MGLHPAGTLMEELRASKDEEELQSMIAAQRISEKALEETLQIIRPGMTEKEVAAELVYRMLRCGSEGNSFDPIVVTGKNTSKPHGVPGDTERFGDMTLTFACQVSFAYFVIVFHCDNHRSSLRMKLSLHSEY